MTDTKGPTGPEPEAAEPKPSKAKPAAAPAGTDDLTAKAEKLAQEA